MASVSILLISAGREKQAQVIPSPELVIEVLSIPEPVIIETPPAPTFYPSEDYLELRSYRVWQPINYREVPPEDKNPIAWVNPPGLLERQLDYILRWGDLIDIVIYEYGYPEEYRMLALGIIAQETQGDEHAICNPFDTERDNCAIGVMAVTPKSWTNTASALMNPRINISVGIWIYDTAYNHALELNFRPGREATRAALAAFNCGWTSLLADNCYSFGGWTYADKVLNYWIPLLETRLGVTQ